MDVLICAKSFQDLGIKGSSAMMQAGKDPALLNLSAFLGYPTVINFNRSAFATCFISTTVVALQPLANCPWALTSYSALCVAELSYV